MDPKKQTVSKQKGTLLAKTKNQELKNKNSGNTGKNYKNNNTGKNDELYKFSYFLTFSNQCASTWSIVFVFTLLIHGGAEAGDQN